MLNYAAGTSVVGYNLTRSLRFRASASAYLTWTPPASGNRKAWTFSAWVKRGTLGSTQILFGWQYLVGGDNFQHVVQLTSSDQIDFSQFNSSLGTYPSRKNTTQVFRDPSAWYHMVFTWDSDNATAEDRARIYINGTRVTAWANNINPTLSLDSYINSVSNPLGLGVGRPNGTVYFDGYMTEVNFIDGQALTPSSFGSTNALTGVWQPARYTGSYGTNGFYLPFTDNSALTTSSNVGLGQDFSGNGNYWTTNNISITAGVTYDSMTDVPTLTSATASNFAVLNPLDTGGVTLSNGNLTYTGSASDVMVRASIFPTSGKWYWEIQANANSLVGTATTSQSNTSYPGGVTGSFGYFGTSGQIFVNTLPITTVATYTTTDVIGLALDTAANTCAIYKNNVLQTTVTSLISPVPAVGRNGSAGSINFGQRPFAYTPPTGFVALNTFNLPTATILKGNTVMDATLYTGNGSSQSIVNAAGFRPDLIWVKVRSAVDNHILVDSVRGSSLYLSSNNTNAETTNAAVVSAINSNGFSVGSSTLANTNASTYVGWQWQANGAAVSNTNGTITSQVSANTSAGFSVVTYTGNGTAGATVGHGLGVAPKMIIVKVRSTGADWYVYHAGMASPKDNVMYLNATNGNTASTVWNNTAPTSSVFSLGSAGAVNGSGSTFVAYCWSEIDGFSKFNSYTGNGSTDGPFIYCGFRPEFVMVKVSSTSENWYMLDSTRNPYNQSGNYLMANLNNSELTNFNYDALSNGFKIRVSGSFANASGGTYIYMAFAENPFKNSLAR